MLLKVISKEWTTYIKSCPSILGSWAHHPNTNLANCLLGGANKPPAVHFLRPWYRFPPRMLVLCIGICLAACCEWFLHGKAWSGPRHIESAGAYVRTSACFDSFCGSRFGMIIQPRQAFPKTKMLKGRFLGIVHTLLVMPFVSSSWRNGKTALLSRF